MRYGMYYRDGDARHFGQDLALYCTIAASVTDGFSYHVLYTWRHPSLLVTRLPDVLDLQHENDDLVYDSTGL